MSTEHRLAPRFVRRIDSKTVQHDAPRLLEASVNRGRESGIDSRFTARRRVGAVTDMVFHAPRPEVHAEGIGEARVAAEVSAGRGSDFDVPLKSSGTAWSTEVVAADARLAVENRPESVTPVAPGVVFRPDSFKKLAAFFPLCLGPLIEKGQPTGSV
jgi:hypothetical protein